MPGYYGPRSRYAEKTVAARDSDRVGRSAAPMVQAQVQSSNVQYQSVVPYTFYSTTNAAAQMIHTSTTAVNAYLPWRGSILALAVKASASCTGTYTVYLNGAATSCYLTLAGSSSNAATYVKGTYPVTAGDTLNVTASSTSTSAVVEVTVFVLQDTTAIV